MAGLPEPLLPPSLVDEVLERLGLHKRPPATTAGMAEAYAAWCRGVPFDNVRKRIHLDAGDPSPLPGSDVAEFFRAWLAHGTGGTCFPTAGGLAALMESLGFEVNRIVGAMLDHAAAPLREDHGTLIVRVPGDQGPGFLLDTAMLHSRPLQLSKGVAAAITDPLHPLTARPQGALWTVDWRRPHDRGAMICRMLREGLDQAELARLYEATRADSGFNAFLYARVTTAEGMSVLIGRGEYRIDRTGRPTKERVTDRRSRLVELGFSEQIAAALPDDLPFD